MNIISRFICAFASLLITCSSQAVLINGDFSSGNFSGWNVLASSFSGEIDSAPFANINEHEGNHYAHVSTGLLGEGLAFLFIDQQVTVVATATTLTADIKLFGPTTDPTGDGGSPFGDAFILGAELADTNLLSALFVDATGTFLGDIGLEFRQASDPFFDFQIVADLSSLVGQTIDVQFLMTSGNDSLVSSFGFDNVELRAVPVPGALLLFASAFAALGLNHRLRK